MCPKVKVAIEDIAYCGGCEMAILDLGKDLIELLDKKIDLVYAPMLMDALDYPSADVVLIVGAPRSDEDIKRIKEARKKANFLVSFGACACWGGIPSLANLSTKDELLKTAYSDVPTIKEKHTTVLSYKRVPKLADRVLPVHKYVDVDYRIPGCPVPPLLIKDTLLTILKKLGA